MPKYIHYTCSQTSQIFCGIENSADNSPKFASGIMVEHLNACVAGQRHNLALGPLNLENCMAIMMVDLLQVPRILSLHLFVDELVDKTIECCLWKAEVIYFQLLKCCEWLRHRGY